MESVCPVFDLLDLVGKKWTFIVVQEIALCSGGFNFLSKQIKKISPKILAQRLHALETQGIVEKIRTPSRSAYQLTDKGREFYHILTFFAQWNQKYEEDLSCAHTQCIECSMYQRLSYNKR
jgi:DNA-binding HxlR family transcriptional regulator